MTRGTLLKGFGLSLVLVASMAVAEERLRSAIRDMVLPRAPKDKALIVHVSGGVATVLRFEQPCDPERTKLLGWEGRFEPLLVGGKKVVLEPLRNLADGESFLLLVTLVDGTEVPFTVVGGSVEVDHQVSVYPYPDTEGALRASLAQSRGRERLYREEAERYREEKTSVDHALAALVANNAMDLTPFRRDQVWNLPGNGVQIEIRSYTRPFALRMAQDEIAPGATGSIAVVFDDRAFESKAAKNGLEHLALALFRSDGRQEVYVVLEVAPQRARK
jgi:hypothetical protein